MAALPAAEPAALRRRVLVVDDHKLVRIGLTTLLDADERLFVAGEAGSVAEAVEAARHCQPDVVVMDVRLPDGSGVDACREILGFLPEARVIMLTSFTDEDALIASILAGAAGYLLKRSDPSRLLDAIDAATRGESILDPAVTPQALAWMQRRGREDTPDALAGLTSQERSVLRLIATGMTNRQIAAQLYLSDQTVKGQVSAIFRKLGFKRRAEAAAFITRERPELVLLAS